MLTMPLERDETYSQADTIKDPNRIPVSPSPSAVLQLVNMESASNRSDTASTPSTPRQPVKSVETLPSLNKIPDIPDSNSKTSTQPEPQADVKPKLLTMALSTASSVASQSKSSRSTGTLRSGSVKTYPLLRPTAESLPPPSTVAPSHHDDGSSTISSAASSQVRRAIQAALDQEARDRAAARNRPLPITPDTSRAPSSVASKTEMPRPEGSVSSPKQEPQKLSKLAMLAQARAGKAEPPKASNPPVIKTDPPNVMKTGGLASPATPQSKESHLSKLAMLAQAKIDPSKRPKLPKTTTEYLTPIANGPTVTTAITTSYQSLYSLTDPSQSSVLPKLNLVPVTEAADASMDLSIAPKRFTKLATKIKKAHERQNVETSRENEDIPVGVPPMFESKSIDSRALPSEFASLLISEEQLQYVDRPRNGRKRETTTDTRRSSRRKHQTHVPPSYHTIQISSAFDGPSPDDVILNARHGTSLGKPRSTASVTSRGTTVPEKS